MQDAGLHLVSKVLRSIPPATRGERRLAGDLVGRSASDIDLVPFAAHDVEGASLSSYEAPPSSFGTGSRGPQDDGVPVEVKGRRLDLVLRELRVTRVDAMKVDVEGAEAAVFRGAPELLGRDDAPFIVFEFDGWAEARIPGGVLGDAQRALRDFGYRLYRADDYARGREPLKDIITHGSEMIVATKR